MEEESRENFKKRVLAIYNKQNPESGVYYEDDLIQEFLNIEDMEYLEFAHLFEENSILDSKDLKEVINEEQQKAIDELLNLEEYKGITLDELIEAVRLSQQMRNNDYEFEPSEELDRIFIDEINLRNLREPLKENNITKEFSEIDKDVTPDERKELIGEMKQIIEEKEQSDKEQGGEEK